MKRTTSATEFTPRARISSRSITVTVDVALVTGRAWTVAVS